MNLLTNPSPSAGSFNPSVSFGNPTPTGFTPPPAAPANVLNLSGTSFAGAKPAATAAPAPQAAASSAPITTLGGGTTPNGTRVDGTGATVATPSNFSISTGGAVPSSVLSTPTSSTGLQNQYQQYVQQLAQATQYSPQYQAALQQLNSTNLKDATLTSNYYTGNNLPGDTLGYAQGYTTREQALNSLDKLGATQNLNVQELIRQGNIGAAKALVDATAPQTVAPGSSLVSPYGGNQIYSGLGGYQAVQGIQTVFNLSQTYPDAGIQPNDDLQTAQAKAATAPSFQLKNPAIAAQVGSYKASLGELQQQESQLQSQISAVDNNYPLLTNIVSQYKLNQSVPLVNQLTNIADKNVGQSGVVQLNAVVTGLKATIAQIVSRGGAVDDKTRTEANNLLPQNATLKVLQDLYGTIKAEGAGVLKGIADEKQKNIQAINGLVYPTTNTSTQSSGGGSLYDF